MEDMVYMIEKPQENCDKMHSDPNSETGWTVSPCISCIDDTILPPQRKLPASVMTRLVCAGRSLAIATLVCCVVITGFGFFTSNDSGSSAMFGFAFDSFFALVSSCILIWRFSSSDRQNSYQTAKRETHATAIVAICMVVSSIAIFLRAVNCLYRTTKPTKPTELLILTSVSFVVYSVLFVSKRVVAKKLGSGSLMTDAMDSFCGAVFAFSILCSAIILKFTTKVWYLDSIIALIVSVFSFIYGIVVIEKLIRVFRKREEKALLEYETKQLMTTDKVFED